MAAWLTGESAVPNGNILAQDILNADTIQISLSFLDEKL